jgi:hypothetical protein
LQKNKERARTGRYPITYRDAKKLAEDVLATKEVDHLMELTLAYSEPLKHNKTLF